MDVLQNIFLGIVVAVGGLLAWYLLFRAVMFLSNLLTGVEAWSKRQRHAQEADRPVPSASGAFEVVTAAVPVAEDGPGRYRIIGVAKDTGDDVELTLHAWTAANARVQAELKGVV